MFKKAFLVVMPMYLLVGTSSLFGVYIGVDYLYWKAQEDGVLYAINLPGGIPNASPGPGTFNAYLQKPHFTWDSGVRLRGGNTWCDGWNTEIVWTHFKNRSCSTTNNPNGGAIAVNFFSIGNNGINGGLGATSRFSLHFDTIDFLVRCDGYEGQCLTVSPTLGIRVARINQGQNIFYSDVTFLASDNQTTVIADATSQQLNNFSAVGLYGGLNAIWELGRGFQLIGVTAAGLLGGKFCVATTINTNNAAAMVDGTMHANRRQVQFFADLLLGFEWTRSWCNGAYDLAVRAGYEMQWWPDQWQAITNILQGIAGFPQPSGDLSLQGLVVGITFGF